MAIAAYFRTEMSAEQFAAANEDLETKGGHGAPPGRTVHVAFNTQQGIHVLDVWESQEHLDAFAEHLMPVLAAHGIASGPPMITEVERVVLG